MKDPEEQERGFTTQQSVKQKFSKMRPEERALLQQLGNFTFHQSFIGLLKKQYGGTNVKQKFIDSNKMYLDHNELAALNEETLRYKKQTTQGSIAITSLFTISALIFGLVTLPTRKSPLKITVIGFGTGILTSYGFWRLQLHRYDQKINLMFRKIVTNQYSEMKGVPL